MASTVTSHPPGLQLLRVGLRQVGDGGPHCCQWVLQLMVQPAQELLVAGPGLLLGLTSGPLGGSSFPASSHGDEQ